MRYRCAATVHRGATPTATTTAQQCDSVSLDFGRVPLVAVLVVPLARLQTTFDVDLLTLRQIFLQALRLLAPQDDAVPFGLFLALPALVVPDLSRRKIQRRYRGAARRVAELRVAAKIADEDHFVHASHRCPSSLGRV